MLVVLLPLTAQEIKFGKVEKAELEATASEIAPNASAEFIYRSRNSYINYYQGSGLSLITQIHERIKIYDKAGLEYATRTIRLYKSGSTKEMLGNVKGFTFNLGAKGVEKTKLEKDQIFETDYNDYLDEVKISFPEVKEGTVIDLTYKITSPFFSSIDEFVFQQDIPTRQLHSSLRIIEYFKYRIRTKGTGYYPPKTETTFNNTLGLDETKIIYDLTNIQPLKKEPFVTNMDNYRDAVKVEIVSLEIPGREYESFAKSWEDVTDAIYKSSSFGSELDKKNYFEDELDAELAGAESTMQRAERILAFVKKKVRWNESRGYGASEGVKQAYKEGEGNVGDINLMLIAMLRHAGIPTQPVLLSTRDNGIPLFPTLQGFNYVIAAAKIGEQTYLLDASDKYSGVGVLPIRALNWLGHKFTEKSATEIIGLIPSEKAVEMLMMNVSMSEDGVLEGQVKRRLTNHYAMIERSDYHEGTEEDFLTEMEEAYGDIEISDFTLGGAGETEKPLEESFTVYAEDVSQVVGDKILFSPLFFLAQEENPLKSEKREYPLDFGFPWQDSFIVNVQIPEGYQVTQLPESVSMGLPNNMGSFRFVAKQRGAAISLNVSVSLDQASIPAEQYGVMKEFFRQIVEKESEQVVLTKTTTNGSQGSTTGGR